MNAISKRSVLSLPRHCTHGSLANVVMPENIESAVTRKDEHEVHCIGRIRRTAVIARVVHGLVGVFDVVEGHLHAVVVVVMSVDGGEHRSESDG